MQRLPMLSLTSYKTSAFLRQRLQPYTLHAWSLNEESACVVHKSDQLKYQSVKTQSSRVRSFVVHTL